MANTDVVKNEDAQQVEDVMAIAGGEDETTVHPADHDPGGEQLIKDDDGKATESQDESNVDVKAEAEADAAETKTETDPFDREILELAEDYGLNEKEARAYPSVAELEQRLVELDARRGQEPVKKVEPEVQPEPELKELEKIIISATDDLDEGTVKQINEAFGKLTQRYDDKNKSLEQAVVGLQSTLQAQQVANFVSGFDSALERLGKGYEHEIGSGSTSGVSTKQRGVRDRVVDEMQFIVAHRQKNNLPIPGDDQLITRALREVLGESKQDNGKVESRQRQFLRRGSSRSSAQPSKRMRARVELREKLDALGGEDG